MRLLAHEPPSARFESKDMPQAIRLAAAKAEHLTSLHEPEIESVVKKRNQVTTTSTRGYTRAKSTKQPALETRLRIKHTTAVQCLACTVMTAYHVNRSCTWRTPR